jgi:hypothetical protein
MAARTIKSTKTVPIIFFSLVTLGLSPIIWPPNWYFLSIVGVMYLLFIGFFVETNSGYLELNEGLLTRKTLLGTCSVKVSDIRQVEGGSSGVFPTSSLNASTVGLGNAKDGLVSINPSSFKKKELVPFIRQLHSELQSTNPQRAKDLQKAFSRYCPE